MNRRATRRSLAGSILAATLTLLFAVPVFAWQGEGGTNYCTDPLLGYVQFRYYDIANVLPPGSGTLYLYRDDDNAWHLRERNGESGGGYWEVLGEPYLDLANTYPGCRNYG